MEPYKTLSCHKIGISHIEKGLECEDYSLSYEDDKISICAISDGHGDKNCFRSAKGAKIACESAIRQIKIFFSYGEETKKALSENYNIALNQLEKSIIAEWTSRVEFDVSKNSFTEKELSPLKDNIKQFFKSNTRPQKAYGCTLIVSAITEYCWFAIQIGDGKCTAIFDDGVYINPIPDDNEGCVGNRSTSICSSNAISSFRHFYGTVLPVAVFVTSDGIEESFSEKDLNKCYYTISYWANTENTASLKEKVNELLPQITKGGSGDDVSLSIIINPSYPAKQSKQSIKEINKCISNYKEHIKSIQEKYEFVSNKYSDIIKKNAVLEKQISELQAEIEKIQQEIVENKKQAGNLFEIENEYLQQKTKLEKMLNLKKSADIFWKSKNELLLLEIDESEFTEI